MIKINVKIKISELEELEPVIKYIQKQLELKNSPELNTEIMIELGE